ncbi:DUF1917-domain-containing protein [Sporormia fimetaria CBS 119925]|uniref:DUF1917-domain-containing protein n=1 Tax=Sporormia fimetaria CBS 119925 TaxID=1340428 RepID=A0A6A6VBP8_9PLEO|nr:DUF1917-domain-containing protein [Sporormia fimetaria CBS 119925]
MKDYVMGDGWISDDSSFFGDEDEKERLLSLCDSFDTSAYWRKSKMADINSLLRPEQPAPDLHNIYKGRFDSWQMHETPEDFVRRLPPLTTTVDVAPWIWVANPHRDGQDRSGRAHVHDELIPRGMQLLQASMQHRASIRASTVPQGRAGVTRTLKQESEALTQRITKLAEETNVLSGKWMLFPSDQDLPRVWKAVVEGTINNRLGSAAKVATDQGNSGNRLICIYTKDFRDKQDVLRILQELERMGLVGRGRGIYYKTDVYTYLDIYGKNAEDYGLRASLYSSQNLLAAANAH